MRDRSSKKLLWYIPKKNKFEIFYYLCHKGIEIRGINTFIFEPKSFPFLRNYFNQRLIQKKIQTVYLFCLSRLFCSAFYYGYWRWTKCTKLSKKHTLIHDPKYNLPSTYRTPNVLKIIYFGITMITLAELSPISCNLDRSIYSWAMEWGTLCGKYADRVVW